MQIYTVLWECKQKPWMLGEKQGGVSWETEKSGLQTRIWTPFWETLLSRCKAEGEERCCPQPTFPEAPSVGSLNGCQTWSLLLRPKVLDEQTGLFHGWWSRTGEAAVCAAPWVVACQELSLQLLQSCGTQEHKHPGHQSPVIRGHPPSCCWKKQGIRRVKAPLLDAGAVERGTGKAQRWLLPGDGKDAHSEQKKKKKMRLPPSVRQRESVKMATSLTPPWRVSPQAPAPQPTWKISQWISHEVRRFPRALLRGLQGERPAPWALWEPPVSSSHVLESPGREPWLFKARCSEGSPLGAGLKSRGLGGGTNPWLLREKLGSVSSLLAAGAPARGVLGVWRRFHPRQGRICRCEAAAELVSGILQRKLFCMQPWNRCVLGKR